MTKAKTVVGSRDGARDRARAHFESGKLTADLARRVAIPTESQNLPASRPALDQYIEREMIPAFRDMGFETKTFENPVKGQGPVLLASRIENAKLPTVLGYGHGDVIRGQDKQWTKGQGPWVLAEDGEKLYGRGSADNKAQHSINMAAMAAVMAERGGQLGFNAKYIIEMAEETGSPGLHDIVRANKDAFAATVLIASDGPRARRDRPTLVLGNRGGLSFDLICRLRDGAHHSGNWGGLIADPAVILCHAISSFVGPRGGLRLRSWMPGPIPPQVKAALADVSIDGGPGAPEIDTWWGEPNLSPAEKVHAWNSFAVLAMTSGNPDAPVNAIAGEARARCQLRYVVGTNPDEIIPALRRHLDQSGFRNVDVKPALDAGAFPATRTDPDSPWAQWVRKSLEVTTSMKPAIIPSAGGGVPNDVFQDILGLPTIWLPHSYAGCQQHAPDEHVLKPVLASALDVMTGLYWDFGAGNLPE